MHLLTLFIKSKIKIKVEKVNITGRPVKHECTSCQMCAAVCSQNAISIRLNEDGFYRPYVDESKCTDCGLCTKVCYKNDNEVKVTTLDEAESIDVYSAQHLSGSLLEKVTSGGVADALAKELINQGCVCIGVTYNYDNHRAEHVIASTVEETDVFRGSKYIQSYSFDAFKSLVNNIRTTKYAVFGLPCHIYAINKFLTLRNHRESCILIDLFCHGCPSMHVWKKYEQGIRNQIGNKRFDDVQFRSKAKGWGKFHIAVDVDGERAFVSTPQNDEFYSLFFSDTVLNDACSKCMLRSTLEYTDIRLGDFWGKRFLNDKKGVSAVAIATERGEQVFEAVKGKFKTEKCTMNEVLVKQSYGKVYSTDAVLRKKMFEALKDDDKTLKDVEKMYCDSQGVSLKLKRLIKYADWYLPFNLTKILKRFYS